MAQLNAEDASPSGPGGGNVKIRLAIYVYNMGNTNDVLLDDLHAPEARGGGRAHANAGSKGGAHGTGADGAGADAYDAGPDSPSGSGEESGTALPMWAASPVSGATGTSPLRTMWPPLLLVAPVPVSGRGKWDPTLPLPLLLGPAGAAALDTLRRRPGRRGAVSGGGGSPAM